MSVVSDLLKDDVKRSVLLLVISAVSLILSFTGVLGPVEVSIVHNVGSVAVVVNSAQLLIHRRR